MREKMGKRFWRGRRATGRAPAETPNEEEYKAPTVGLRKVTSTESTPQDEGDKTGHYGAGPGPS